MTSLVRWATEATASLASSVIVGRAGGRAEGESDLTASLAVSADMLGSLLGTDDPRSGEAIRIPSRPPGGFRRAAGQAVVFGRGRGACAVRKRSRKCAIGAHGRFFLWSAAVPAAFP